MIILIPGAAGFIGYHLSISLLKNGFRVAGIDNFSDYYDPELKQARLKKLQMVSKKTGTPFFHNQVDLNENDKIKNI